MTVISLLISHQCSVHATDSLITGFAQNGKREILEQQQPKIVPIKHFRGALSYWGLAEYGPQQKIWRVYDWLKSKAQVATKTESPETFANLLADELSEIIRRLRGFPQPHFGLGIHFSAYEYINNYWIPELFLISNWTDPTYSQIDTDGFRVSRHTYGAVASIVERLPEHREPEYRLRVHEYLQNGRLLMYNNGDPTLFNMTSGIFSAAFHILSDRKQLRKSADIKMYSRMARRPIEVIANIQRDFCEPGTRMVGGKIHDLAITPNGEYFSNTGAK